MEVIIVADRQIYPSSALKIGVPRRRQKLWSRQSTTRCSKTSIYGIVHQTEP